MLSQWRKFFIRLRLHYVSYGRNDNDIFEVRDVNLLQLGFVLAHMQEEQNALRVCISQLAGDSFGDMVAS